jgi:hypothetical protein
MVRDDRLGDVSVVELDKDPFNATLWPGRRLPKTGS